MGSFGEPGAAATGEGKPVNKYAEKAIQALISVERWPSQALILPRVQAHRGYCGEGAMENSLASLRAARAKGALMYECDIRLSKDQVPMLVHDADILRISGEPGLVAEMTAKELAAKAGLCRLEEALMDPASPRLANIEMKSKVLIDDPLERKIADVVKKCKAEKRVLFSSFNPMSIVRMGLHLPDVPRALLVSSSDDPENNYLLKNMMLAPFLSFHMLNLDTNLVTEENMSAWRAKRTPVSVWTIKNKEDVQKYLKMGVVSVISDIL